MAVGRKETLSGARGTLGTLLVAWTFITGSALVIATAYYQRTGDLKVIIAWLGAPFLIGTALFLCVALVWAASRSKPRYHDDIIPHTGTKSLHQRR